MHAAKKRNGLICNSMKSPDKDEVLAVPRFIKFWGYDASLALAKLDVHDMLLLQNTPRVPVLRAAAVSRLLLPVNNLPRYKLQSLLLCALIEVSTAQ